MGGLGTVRAAAGSVAGTVQQRTLYAPGGVVAAETVVVPLVVQRASVDASPVEDRSVAAQQVVDQQVAVQVAGRPHT